MLDVLSKLNQLELSARKVRMKMEYLQTEIAQLKEENTELKNQLSEINTAEVIGETNTDFNHIGIDRIKKELEGYVVEIETCLKILE